MLIFKCACAGVGSRNPRTPGVNRDFESNHHHGEPSASNDFVARHESTAGVFLGSVASSTRGGRREGE